MKFLRQGLQPLCSSIMFLRCLPKRIPVSRSNFRLLFLLAWASSAMLLFIYLPYLHDNHKHKSKEHDAYDDYADSPVRSLQTISQALTQGYKCPACFGIDMCDEIREANLMIELPSTRTEANRKGVYFGRWANFHDSWGGTHVVVKTYDAAKDSFNRLDSYLCKLSNISITGTEQARTCDVSKSIKENRAKLEQLLIGDNVKDAYKITHSHPKELSYSVCSTKNLMSTLRLQFDNDQDGNLTDEEMGYFVTSLLVQPEAGLLGFLSELDIFRVPRYMGACGRTIVMEDGGAPLETYLNSTWKVRVELALQVLDAVERFVEIHSEWAILFTEYSYDNLAVREGVEGYRLVVVDLEDIIIVEKDVPFDQMVEKGLNYVCNQECFDKYWESLMAVGSQGQAEQCQKAGTVGLNTMYSLACRELLLRTNEHAGLLHSAPAEVHKALNEALLECVQETSPGSRLKAVKSLFTLLMPFAEINDMPDD